jgi:Glycosyltransferase (GlcNAc)
MANNKPLIYVQVPAYRDTELAKTLEQLLDKAAYPDRLRVAVLWQHGPGEKLPSSILAKKNIEIVKVPHTKSKGCNWARIQLQQKWKGEPYTLFIDSHHRFVRGWEEKTVEMYEQLRSSGVKKPIITAYLPSYNPARDPKERLRSALKTYFLERTAGILTRITSYEITGWRSLSKPIPADYLSLPRGVSTKKFPLTRRSILPGTK